jgi:ArsR family transcriptional regulator, arsenate/arsenite/antimonite-responsive transcriptional repressor / arsenate reductase (thioredoxin)
VDEDVSLPARAARHAALGDPTRLAIDELVASDRSPLELQRLTGAASNLLAHHLDVLEGVGIISRRRSSGDGRRRYIRLNRVASRDIAFGHVRLPEPALFVCTHNSARSQIAAALWKQLTDQPAESAGTHPARRVHPGAVASARRAGLDLRQAVPCHLDEVSPRPRLVITVCDRAHEELTAEASWLHWSVPDPVATPSRATFDATVAELRERITAMVVVS